MIERVAGCLEHGGRTVLPASKKQFRSRRHLHSAFWSHGAGNIDLPSWWILLLQTQPSSCEPRTSKTISQTTAAVSEGLHSIFLDFLYPVKTLALICQLKRSTDVHIRAAQNLKRTSRAYTSVAATLVNGAEKAGRARKKKSKEYMQTVEKDESTELVREAGDKRNIQVVDKQASATSSFHRSQAEDVIRRNIYELLDTQDVTGAHDEVWQSYQDLLESSQSLPPKVLVKMLRFFAGSSRTVDVERAVALFESIPFEERHAIHYSHAVSAALTLNDLNIAVAIHHEAFSRINGSIGTSALLRYAIQQARWTVAIDVWLAFWEHRLLYFTRPDIWTGVDSLPLSELMDKAISVAKYALSVTKSGKHGHVTAREFALEIIARAFSIHGSPVDDTKHQQLVQMAKSLDSSSTKTDSLALGQLLSIDDHKHKARALELYRTIRMDTNFTPSYNLLVAIGDIVLSNKQIADILMVIDDWHDRHRDPPVSFIQPAIKALAFRGQLEAVRKLFDRYFEQYKYTRFHLHFIDSLLIVHNRRADTKGVVQVFNAFVNQGLKVGLRAWHTVIATFCRVDDINEAMKWFNKLRETNLQADSRVYRSLMLMFARRGDIEAVNDLLQQSKNEGVQTTSEMLNTLITAFIKDGRLEEAEKLINESSSVESNTKDSRVSMWNALMNAYGLRQDLDKVSQLHKRMHEAGLVPNSMTYAALIMALAVSGQPDAAKKVATRVMPRLNIEQLALHYGHVMGRYLGTQEYHKIFQLYKTMLSQRLTPNMSTQNVVLRAAVAIDREKEAAGEGIEGQPESSLGQDTLDQIVTNLDPAELAANEPRKFVGAQPLDEAFSSSYFEYLIFTYGKQSAFDKVAEVYDRYLVTARRFPSSQNIESSPPMRMASALMVAHINAGNHDEVDRCWYLALDRCEKLACRHKAKVSEPGWVLHSRRFIINLPLYNYIDYFGEQQRTDDLVATINSLLKAGYALNGHNWNRYVQQLARSSNDKHHVLAFEICEEELIPSWPGWTALGGPDSTQYKTRAISKNMVRQHHLKMPTYPTLVQLAAVYLRARNRRDGSLVDSPAALMRVASRTVDAVNNMPKMEDTPQSTILRGDE